MSEPNVLILDRFEYALDDEPWQEPEDILRADNALRARAGLPSRGGNSVQPWLLPYEDAKHTAHLRFRCYADRAFSSAIS